MKVTFSEEALSGLRRIAAYIAEDSPRRAVSFIRELRQAAKAIGGSPSAFAFVDGFERLGLRRRVHGSYVIVYRIEVDQVAIVLIAHAAQDYGRLLDPSVG